MIKLASSTLFLLTAVSSASNDVTIRDDSDHELSLRHRELIFDFCPQLPFVECTCSSSLLPPKFSTECVLDNDVDGELCGPFTNIVCGVPAIVTTFDLFRLFTLRLPLGAEICYNDLSVFDFEIPFIGDLCIDFFDPIGSFLDLITFGLLPRSEPRNTFSTYEDCSANVNGEKCEMCQICDDGLGGTSVVFKCGDIEKLTCTTLLAAQLPSSLSEAPDLTKAVPLRIGDP